MVKTQEEILEETGGIMTSESARGSPNYEPSDEEKIELIAGESKENLNDDL